MFIKVSLNKDIINECLALHYNNQPAGKKLKQRLLWIPLILLVLAAFLIADELRQPALSTNFYMALSYIAFAIAYYFYLKIRLMKAGGRMFRALGSNANFTIEVGDNELITQTQTDTFNHSWASFTGSLIGVDNVLLYQSNNTFTMLHHTFFEPGDFEKFKNLVRKYVDPVKEVNH